MRRIVAVLTVALIMVAMMAFAAPAFAQTTIGGLVVDPGAKTEHIPECVDEMVTTGEPGMHCMLLHSTPAVSPL